ncbi:MAG TPA: ATP-binding protein, partial [Prolixibacteraceae bacterium]|nr:ATP-binding protein [Prolixibacteraceae bacterium]
DGNNDRLQERELSLQKEGWDDLFPIAHWVFHQMVPAGRFTENFSNSDRTFYPLPGIRMIPGVVVVKLGEAFSGDKKNFWETCLALISNALEREFLDEMARKARFLDESDRLYKTLFNSISHELRIPVATIMGASDALLSGTHPDPVRHELLDEIVTATVRLNRLIENLLNMSRLESGRLSVRLDWYDMNDLFNKVSEELANELSAFSFRITIPEDMPLAKFDFGLMEQVLYNLLYNSVQHAPAASEINLIAGHRDGKLIIKVSDQGPGLPKEMLPDHFKKFHKAGTGKTGGLGLGLSIAKGFVEAHKGTIVAKNNPTGGACFELSIPSENPVMNELKLDNE